MSANIWSLSGNRLPLRWPNAGAPGGAWVDQLWLSDDGQSYVGRNQTGSLVRGRFQSALLA